MKGFRLALGYLEHLPRLLDDPSLMRELTGGDIENRVNIFTMLNISEKFYAFRKSNRIWKRLSRNTVLPGKLKDTVLSILIGAEVICKIVQ